MKVSQDPFRWIALARDAAGFAIAAGTGIVVWHRKRSSRYWPTAFGKVESASSFENVGQWLTDVAYSYSVDGEFYSGQFRLTSRNERKADEHELRWKGRNIAVRHSSRNKSISVVRTEDQAGLYGGEFKGH
jgi:hypothetical protein